MARNGQPQLGEHDEIAEFKKQQSIISTAECSENEEEENGQKAKEAAPQKVPLAQLFRYASGREMVLLFIGITVSCITGAGLPVMSILTGQVSQAFVNEQMFKSGLWNYSHPNVTYNEQTEFTNVVMNVVYGYAGMAIAIFISANVQVTCFLIVCEQMSNRIRRLFVKAILRQDISWFDKNNSGTLAPQLFDNLERVKEGTGDKIGLMFQMLSQFFSGFIIAFIHSWKLTLVMLAFTPLQAACGFAIAKSMTTFTMVETKKYARAGKILEQAISCIRTVVSLSGLEYELQRYKDAVAESRRAGIIKNLLMGISFGCMGLTNFSSLALAFYVGVNWVYDGSISVADLMTTFFSVMMGSIALGQAGPQFAVVGAAQGAAAPIYEVLDREPDIDSTSCSGVQGTPIKGDIEVKNVVFRYPSRPDVQILNRISLSVRAGETVALVGSSGCGKSTIVSLLLRYYDVEAGQITIDGIPLRDINVEFLRNQIAVVSQEPILFNCSIEDNIKFGREDITETEMIAACKMANAHVFISGLPQGYHTLVGDRGTQLSGGQKQRIAIARALVRNPRILLLDEATSALDAESEGVVQAALDKASKGRTTIIIAHRLSTIRNADKIIAIKSGEVAEFGTHASLLTQRGLYFDLVNAQTFSDAVDDVKAADEKSNSRRNSRVSFRRGTSVQSTVDVNRIRSATVMSIEQGFAEEEEESKEKKDDMTRLKRELKEENVSKTNLFEIFSHAKSSWPTLMIGLSACLVGGLVFPTYSVFFSQVLQVFTDESTMLSKGHFWALMFLVLAVVQGSTFFLQTFFMGYSAENMAADLRNGLFRNILSQDMGYFDSPKHASGKICTRLATDVPNLRNAMDFRFSTVLYTLVSIVAGVCLAFYYGWKMAFLSVGFLPILGFGQALRTRVMQGKHRTNAKDFEDSGKIAMEAIEHVRTVQALTKENTFYTKFCHFLDGPHNDAVRQAFVQGLAYGFATCVIYILNCISYRLGLFLILDGQMEPMRVLRVMYAISISATTLGFATSYFPEYMKARLAGGIIFNMLREPTKIDNLSIEGKQANLTGAVTFEDVRFNYPERPSVEILKGLSFTLKPGQTLALVGPSGCGKSTVVALIERFYDPKSGRILLDSHEIRSLNPMHMRRQMAIVSQEPILFDASIAENIRYGMSEYADDARVEEAARKANIHNFIKQLPEGYNTSVGEKGTQLSGGQKQRIAIARALVRNPRILLLDEATSALDTESEKIVQDALDRAREGRTCIVIAHRLSTVVNADCIAVVKNGVIVEKGTHNELLAARGAYFALTQKQTGGAKQTSVLTENEKE